jgi:hypothetical protein
MGATEGGVRIAEAVEHALRLSESIGRQPAARLMVAAGVPDTVIARVLCEPPERRRTAPRPTR